MKKRINSIKKFPWVTSSWFVLFAVLVLSDQPTWHTVPLGLLMLAIITAVAFKTHRGIWAVPIWADIERYGNDHPFPIKMIRKADKEHRQLLRGLRKDWERLTKEIGLTKGPEENLRYPMVKDIGFEQRGPILSVKPATGGSLHDWEKKAPALTSELERNVIVTRSARPGRVEVQLEIYDPLADTRDAQLPDSWDV